MRGRFISLEGGEGAGKSTVLAAIAGQLRETGIDPLLLREPGGSKVGEAIRAILLNPAMGELCAETELLLMFASRAQLVREHIRPALAAGRWVLSDRYTGASFAYQGGGRGQPTSRIADLERWAADSLKPDLTLLLDLPVAQGLARAGERSVRDRIEMESVDFFTRVRSAYRERARSEPLRFCMIDASQSLPSVLEQVHAQIRQFLDAQGALA